MCFKAIGRKSETNITVACRARETRCGGTAGGEVWTSILTGNAIFMGSSLPYGGWFFRKLRQRTVFVGNHGTRLVSKDSPSQGDSGRAVCYDFRQFTLRCRAKIQTIDERVQDNRRNIIYFPNKNTIPARTHVNKSKTKTTNSWSTRRTTTSEITRATPTVCLVVVDPYVYYCWAASVAP